MSTGPSRAARLRALIAGDRAVLTPGCYDALSAALIERQGFAAAYLSGASIAYTKLGRPDIGLVSAAEVADTIAHICERVDIPLIVDADTGFGNALNAQRTVKMFERMGATALQLEDQQAPKRCGHLSGKSLVPIGEMVGKIKAALDVRDDALIIARTDAIAVEGVSAALDRAHAYVEAGADILFVEAPPNEETMRRICTTFGSRVPLVANMVEGGTTPMLPLEQLSALGFRLVIYPGALVRALVFAATSMLETLKADGTTEAYRDRMVDIGELNGLLGTQDILEAGKAYDPDLQGFGIERG